MKQFHIDCSHYGSGGHGQNQFPDWILKQMQGIQKDQTAGNHCEQRGNGTRNVTSVYKSRSNEVYENEVQDIGGQEAKPQFIVSRKVTERRYKGQKQQLLADSDREAFRIEKCAEWDEAYPNKSFFGSLTVFPWDGENDLFHIVEDKQERQQPYNCFHKSSSPFPPIVRSPEKSFNHQMERN